MVDDEVILSTAREVAEYAKDIEKCEYALMFSCISRLIGLNFETKELLEVRSVMDGNFKNYQLAYSDSELCPMKKPNGTLVNRSHNFSYTLLALCNS